ncbi:Nramp family divalent metal transporter [Sporolactobacillus sp. THM19-2]|jgi:Mn2+/Fe2+ NRAMP family transporter|uniref:Nramp family divalent metal transporter n=1 Tax=Sporolactobacillus sp. THM19-2 TaxID=2511171 RepID=UPI001981D789|nr:Nramp family divalent metal transporter [Sporolactobacillus sp. THM19-2]
MAKLETTVPSLPPQTLKERMIKVGPGFVVAATSIGAPDLLASIVVGQSYGMTFLWAIIIGTIIKYYLNEGVGRWHLATGTTILEGWRSLGRWATGYFGVYAVIWGFVYGATAAMASGMAMNAMWPVLPIWGWAIIHAVAGFLLVYTGKYKLFEQVMTFLVGLMFLTIVGLACFFLPGLKELSWGLVPTVPDGSLYLVLGLIGGVGGTITMASYGYWIKEKNWTGKSWIPMMKTDAKVGYIITGVFCISALIIGAQFLYGTNVEIRGDQGFVTMSNMLADQFGEPMRWTLLLAFWSAVFSSLLGVWNGVPYLFADFVRTIRMKKNKELADKPVTEKDPMYRLYLFWLTFPPMIMYFFGKPVELIILYGVLGSLFMPFLAITLTILLNSKKVDRDARNRWLTNAVLIGCIMMFGFLGLTELLDLF